MQILPNGILASGSTDGKIKLWNDDFECLKIIDTDGHVCCFDLLPNRILASGSESSAVMFWNANNLKELQLISDNQ